MILVDVIVVGALVIALILGVVRGFLASVGTITGLVAGALAALWLVPLAGPLIPDAAWRGFALAAGAVVLVVLGTVIGATLGDLLRRGVERTPLRWLDRLTGGVFSLVAMALAVLLVSATMTVTGAPVVASAVASSRVLSWIDDLTPAPVDAVLAQLRGIVIDEGLPRLGELLRPEVAPTAPPIALDDPELQAAAASVARISGTAYACGVAMTGSGFVAGEDLVVTNAHVVAGVEMPLVELPGRSVLEGRVVYFDPIGDLAVIAVGGLAAVPLAVADPVVAGAAVAVQGYPLGGPFTSTPAHVLSVGTVPVPDIHDEDVAMREIYSLEANVLPGNSGGPLLTDAGQVTGVVFARGEEGESRGYAMTTNELRPALAASSTAGPTVSTGSCIA